LYPETGDFVARNDDFVAVLTKSPVSGYKVARFRRQRRRFRQQVSRLHWSSFFKYIDYWSIEYQATLRTLRTLSSV